MYIKAQHSYPLTLFPSTAIVKDETFNLSHLTKELTSAEEHIAFVEEESDPPDENRSVGLIYSTVPWFGGSL